MVAGEPPHISDNSSKFSSTLVYCSAEILPDAFYLLFHSIITLLGLRFFSIALFVESFIFLLSYLLSDFVGSVRTSGSNSSGKSTTMQRPISIYIEATIGDKIVEKSRRCCPINIA